MTFEIRKVKNGYAIFEGSTAHLRQSIDGSPWVFETLEAAMVFLRQQFEPLGGEDATK